MTECSFLLCVSVLKFEHTYTHASAGQCERCRVRKTGCLRYVSLHVGRGNLHTVTSPRRFVCLSTRMEAELNFVNVNNSLIQLSIAVGLV